MTTTTAELARRHNNLDFLRLLGAFAVIVGHSFELTGQGERVPRILGAPLHSVGVWVFFTISGYLITKSWQRRPSLVPYLTARILRIFPALIVVVLGSVLVLGPVLTSLSTADYFSNSTTWRYLINIGLRPTFRLPGVFEQLPYAGSVNGSLWTLPAEFAGYLAVPLLLIVRGRARLVLVAAVGVLIAVYALHSQGTTTPLVVYGTSIAQASTPWVFFVGGVLCALVLKPAAYRLDLALLFFALIVVGTAVVPQWYRVVLWILLPYVILSFGLAATPILRRASRFGDFSYGLYIFAFPVQQIVVAHFGVLPLRVDIVVVTLVTLVIAAVSWHVVEAPAMRLKAVVEGRFRRRSVVPSGV